MNATSEPLVLSLHDLFGVVTNRAIYCSSSPSTMYLRARRSMYHRARHMSFTAKIDGVTLTNTVCTYIGMMKSFLISYSYGFSSEPLYVGLYLYYACMGFVVSQGVEGNSLLIFVLNASVFHIRYNRCFTFAFPTHEGTCLPTCY